MMSVFWIIDPKSITCGCRLMHMMLLVDYNIPIRVSIFIHFVYWSFEYQNWLGSVNYLVPTSANHCLKDQLLQLSILLIMSIKHIFRTHQ